MLFSFERVFQQIHFLETKSDKPGRFEIPLSVPTADYYCRRREYLWSFELLELLCRNMSIESLATDRSHIDPLLIGVSTCLIPLSKRHSILDFKSCTISEPPRPVEGIRCTPKASSVGFRVLHQGLIACSRLHASILAFRLASNNSPSRSFILATMASATLPSTGMGTVYSTSNVTLVAPASG
jgi:hypothetical protein